MLTLQSYSLLPSTNYHCEGYVKVKGWNNFTFGRAVFLLAVVYILCPALKRGGFDSWPKLLQI